jgi:hypothetical protein
MSTFVGDATGFAATTSDAAPSPPAFTATTLKK